MRPGQMLHAAIGKKPESPVDERLKHCDPRMIEAIEGEMVNLDDNKIGWDDIAGCVLSESLFS